ncbi:hypothetical protein ACYFX5_13355 [Bremerella sp. T1]|uniref:hypothetical protein n=1 Tax=Bremerella sp. TYQ1 TaxID=3119568 RepID=UPI001CCA426B|nr:hypothetical protein [Bremerella volcania]UBM34046.1 hypothetical protein LA756_15295 [Bremerella volcania]
MKIKQIAIACVFLLWGGLHVAVSHAEEPTFERWDRAICLLEQQVDKENNKQKFDWSTCFLLQDEHHITLVATAHGARLTSSNTKVIFRRANGESGLLTLGQLSAGEGNPWRFHPNADVAVMRLDDVEEANELRKELVRLAIPRKNVSVTLPRRSTSVEMAGYPLGLGIQGVNQQTETSPLVVSGEIASRELPFSTKWGSESIILVQVAAPGGISGSPVFRREESPETCEVLGMVMGYVREDSSGLMMSKVIPGHVLIDAIEGAYSRFSE